MGIRVIGSDVKEPAEKKITAPMPATIASAPVSAKTRLRSFPRRFIVLGISSGRSFRWIDQTAMTSDTQDGHSTDLILSARQGMYGIAQMRPRAILACPYMG